MATAHAGPGTAESTRDPLMFACLSPSERFDSAGQKMLQNMFDSMLHVVSRMDTEADPSALGTTVLTRRTWLWRPTISDIPLQHSAGVLFSHKLLSLALYTGSQVFGVVSCHLGSIITKSPTRKALRGINANIASDITCFCLECFLSYKKSDRHLFDASATLTTVTNRSQKSARWPCHQGPSCWSC